MRAVCEADFTLMAMGVAVFSVYNVGEIFETISIASWIRRFPTSSQHEQLTFSQSMFHQITTPLTLLCILKKCILFVADEDGDKEVTSGMTLGYKCFCYIAIIIPKLVIGLLLAYYGSGFLWTSGS